MLRLLVLLILMVFSSAAIAGVNINTAGEAELETLPGIGPVKAAAIVTYREQHGPFSSVEALDAVSGIGPATMTNLRGLVTTDDGVVLPTEPPRVGPPEGGAVDVNKASVVELISLAGVGAGKAAAGVGYRERDGRFDGGRDLVNGRGDGPPTVRSRLPR